ncbi:hypothetical protein MHZ95_10520, partial [Sporosarcina sp. ACRSM]|uniref:hypothetical protein n=1 Tax=Sporosarcina sp. ACRSM TaxID=2918216 RepID=UPI001EF60F35
MNSENIKNNDPIQLKQMIIFLKAELTKYEHKVKEYKDSYHYSIIENLEQENVQLTKENDELKKQLHEMQRRRYSPAVDFVWKTKTDWLPVNKQLNEVMKKLKDDADTNQTRHRRQERQITSLHKKFKAHKSNLEQFEYRLIDLIQNMTNQVHNQLANVSITNEERHRFEDGRRRLLKKIEEKNIKIEELQHEMIEVKKQKALSEDNMITATLKSESTKTSDRLLQLEYQLKEVVAKSLDAEKKRAAKLDIFDDMKQRYLKEIEEKNSKIEELQHEMIEVKKQKVLSEDNMITATLKSESTKTSDRLLQLEYQLKEVVAKSLDAE